MKKEIRTVDKEHKVIQVTTVDERWYIHEVQDQQTGLPRHEFVPSVTWICDSYPKGVAFYKWLANHGWDESIALRDAAGDKGSKIHYASNALLDGKEVAMTDKFLNNSLGADEELSLEEYQALMSFVEWYEQTKPKIIAREFVIFGDGYAGMVDMLVRIENKLYILDLKSSQYIWPSHELQVSAYKKAVVEKMQEEIGLLILQVGYKLNKRHWKLTEIEDKYEQFLAAKTIWQNEHGNERPRQAEYPLSLKLNICEQQPNPEQEAKSHESNSKTGSADGANRGRKSSGSLRGNHRPGNAVQRDV